MPGDKSMGCSMRRLIVLLMLVFASAFSLTTAARADDISASARGVVRIVTIAVVNDEVVGFGHGSGFAVAPNRIVTNAHVVELAARYPDNVVIGVVPSEGNRSFQGRLVAIDPDRDLALIEFSGARLPPLAVFKGPVSDGEALVALGYPGNVDLATAQSARDFITPLSPVRSQGNFAGMRSLRGTAMLLHTASIARGNSGGPLLDRCGRVLGVNVAITNSEGGDANFAFAISGQELGAFLAEAKQPFGEVAVPCVSVEERMAQDRNADEQAQAQAAEAERQAAAKAAAEREDALTQARANNEAQRENYMAGAAVLLVLGALCLGAAGMLLSRGQQRAALWLAIGGVVLMIGAAVLFFSRPSFDATKVVAVTSADAAKGSKLPGTAATGRLVCTLDPQRSRVTTTTTERVELTMGPDGCINGKTQYAESGSRWQRILVPNEEATVSVLDYDPASRTYTNTRYLLSSEQMDRARQLRAGVQLKTCSQDQAARGQLATSQQEIKAALPQLYNEKLVYRCGAATTSDAAAIEAN